LIEVSDPFSEEEFISSVESDVGDVEETMGRFATEAHAVMASIGAPS
jgi:hypothetical protein